ncbi:hypothetical protein HDU88_008186 [Geranomyces variabilis]|nr:hypothetical protein HDU88_008186 [Geranomyces variabilis]
MFEIGWALGGDMYAEPLFQQDDQIKVAQLLRNTFAKTPCDFVSFSTCNCDEVLLRRLVDFDLSPNWRLYNPHDLVKRVWPPKHSQTVEAVTDREQPKKLAFPSRSLPYLMSQVLPDKPYTAHDPDQDAKALLDLVEFLRAWYNGSKPRDLCIWGASPLHIKGIQHIYTKATSGFHRGRERIDWRHHKEKLLRQAVFEQLGLREEDVELDLVDGGTDGRVFTLLTQSEGGKPRLDRKWPGPHGTSTSTLRLAPTE